MIVIVIYSCDYFDSAECFQDSVRWGVGHTWCSSVLYQLPEFSWCFSQPYWTTRATSIVTSAWVSVNFLGLLAFYRVNMIVTCVLGRMPRSEKWRIFCVWWDICHILCSAVCTMIFAKKKKKRKKKKFCIADIRVKNKWLLWCSVVLLVGRSGIRSFSNRNKERITLIYQASPKSETSVRN